MASGATCVQRLDGSRDSAIHTKYRISLRSSSMREPRYPLPRVVLDTDSCTASRAAPSPGRREQCVSIGFPWRALRRGSLCCREAPPPRRKERPPEQREGRGDGFAGRSGAGRPFVGIPCTASESEACRGGPDRAQRAASGQEREDSSSVRRLPWAGVGRRGTIEGLEFRRTGSQHRNRQLASEAVTALGAAMRSRTSVQFGARARSLRARTTETPLTRHHVHKEQPRQPDHDSPTSAGRAMEATGGAVPAPLGMTGKPGNAGVRHRPRVHRRLRPRGARRASPRKARHVSRGRVDPFETST
ncbi:Senescence-associated protein [Quillaja saponaria]|uniref:Senescence-associated protein n=1 Tax=Quillaja saponaria TaxID=32244 RepID=A0AAD7P464_QUISA|nr:Senescence-associated protein [Quillaja saponaria]